MSDSRIQSEIACLERALEEKVQYFETQNKPLSREEIANAMRLMNLELIAHLKHIFN